MANRETDPPGSSSEVRGGGVREEQKGNTQKSRINNVGKPRTRERKKKIHFRARVPQRINRLTGEGLKVLERGRDHGREEVSVHNFYLRPDLTAGKVQERTNKSGKMKERQKGDTLEGTAAGTWLKAGLWRSPAPLSKKAREKTRWDLSRKKKTRSGVGVSEGQGADAITEKPHRISRGSQKKQIGGKREN